MGGERKGRGGGKPGMGADIMESVFMGQAALDVVIYASVIGSMSERKRPDWLSSCLSHSPRRDGGNSWEVLFYALN